MPTFISPLLAVVIFAVCTTASPLPLPSCPALLPTLSVILLNTTNDTPMAAQPSSTVAAALNRRSPDDFPVYDANATLPDAVIILFILGTCAVVALYIHYRSPFFRLRQRYFPEHTNIPGTFSPVSRDSFDSYTSTHSDDDSANDKEEENPLVRSRRRWSELRASAAAAAADAKTRGYVPGSMNPGVLEPATLPEGIAISLGVPNIIITPPIPEIVVTPPKEHVWFAPDVEFEEGGGSGCAGDGAEVVEQNERPEMEERRVTYGVIGPKRGSLLNSVGVLEAQPRRAKGKGKW